MKDYYESFCIKKNLIGMIFGFGCIFFIVFTMHNLYAYFLMVGVTLPMIGVSTLQYSMEQDEISNYDQMLLTFPLLRKEIVQAKLTATLLFTLISNMVVSLSIMMIYVFLYHAIDFQTGLLVWIAGFILSFIFTAINSMGFFWLGNKRGSIFYIIFMIILAVTYVGANFSIGIEQILSLGTNILILIGVILAIVMNVISYFACVKIYTKKHS